MHREILTAHQLELIPLVASFAPQFGLVGGTAIALYIGHRESIDFDLFTGDTFENTKLKRKLVRSPFPTRMIRDDDGQMTLTLHEVRMTFYLFPYPIPFTHSFEGVPMPDLLTLAAMKALALGGRAKWKDYVDLYFLLKDYYALPIIMTRANELFGDNFNERLFREQLSYFADINYSEQVIFRPGFETADTVIKDALTEWSLS